jgi:L-alanine-DL-glutamate epimerase-like enolase superfamily enzyme
MAHMAGSRGKFICPHNWQDGLITAANAHLLAAVPTRFLLESNMPPNPFKKRLFKGNIGANVGQLLASQPPVAWLGLSL